MPLSATKTHSGGTRGSLQRQHESPVIDLIVIGEFEGPSRLPADQRFKSQDFIEPQTLDPMASTADLVSIIMQHVPAPEVDADAPLCRPSQFTYHVGYTERGKADNQERLTTFVDHFTDHGTRKPDRRGVADRATDDGLAAVRNVHGVDESGGLQGKSHGRTR
jgi:hypothetical protein